MDFGPSAERNERIAHRVAREAKFDEIPAPLSAAFFRFRSRTAYRHDLLLARYR
jgi:hypothetical protein